MTRVADTVQFESSMATPVSHKLLSQTDIEQVLKEKNSFILC
jgi:hypothetical protein